MPAFYTVDIFGIRFPILDYDTTLELFKNWIDGGESHQVCIANVHTTVESLSDTAFRDIANRSLSTMDG